MTTTPDDVTFTGKGSRYSTANGNDAAVQDFTVINDGEEIQGSSDGEELRPQQGLELTDPEQIGPKLYQQYTDSQNK